MATTSIATTSIATPKVTIKSLREEALSFFSFETNNDVFPYRSKNVFTSPLIKSDKCFIGGREIFLDYHFSDKGQDKIASYCCNCNSLSTVDNILGYHSFRFNCKNCLSEHNQSNFFSIDPFIDFEGERKHIGRSKMMSKIMKVDTKGKYIIFCTFQVSEVFNYSHLEKFPDKEYFKKIYESRTYQYSDPEIYIFSDLWGVRKITSKGTSQVKKTTCTSHYYQAAPFIEDKCWEEFVAYTEPLGLKINKKDKEKLGSEFLSELLLRNIKTTHDEKIKDKEEEKKEKENEVVKKHLSMDYSKDIDNKLHDLIQGMPSGYKISNVASRKTIKLVCSDCGQFHEEDILLSENKIECPACGKMHNIIDSIKYIVNNDNDMISLKNVFLYWYLNTENDLCVDEIGVIRQFYFNDNKFSFKWVRNHTTIYKPNKSIEIVYCNTLKDDNAMIDSHNFGPTVFAEIEKRGSTSCSNRTFNFFRNYFRVNDGAINNDFQSIVKLSNLNKTGLVESLSITNPLISYVPAKEAANSCKLAYMELYYKYPIVELLIKCGMSSAVRDFEKNTASEIKDTYQIKYKEKNIQKAFGLTKSQFKICRENNLNWDQITSLKLHQKYDPNIGFAEFDWSTTNYSTSKNSIILNLLETGYLKFDQIKRYIESCYFNQCIPRNESARLWYDYIKIMKRLNFSEKEIKKELFPRSLKKSHDVLNFASLNIINRENAEAFLETVEATKKYQYSFEEYQIVTPSCAEDLIREGIALNHSVAQHIELVASRREHICFIRRKSNLSESFYTVELSMNGEIIQVRGMSNKPVTEPDILFFIKKWATYKKLKIVEM